MNIMITRLITGEEILGEVESSSDAENCNITNPTQVSAMPNPQTGNVDVHMGPFAPLSAQKTITLSRRNVLCQYEPVVDIKNKYSSMFSGIILPKNSGIITSD